MAKISGILKNPAGETIYNAKLVFVSMKTTGDVLVSTRAVEVSETGTYDVDIYPGRYLVSLHINGYPSTNLGYISVYSDSPDGTINDFIITVNESDVTPEFLVQVVSERAAAESAAAAAEISAQEAKDAAETATGGGVEEAPEDNLKYARSNKSWVEIIADDSGEITENNVEKVVFDMEFCQNLKRSRYVFNPTPGDSILIYFPISVDSDFGGKEDAWEKVTMTADTKFVFDVADLSTLSGNLSLKIYILPESSVGEYEVNIDFANFLRTSVFSTKNSIKYETSPLSIINTYESSDATSFSLDTQSNINPVDIEKAINTFGAENMKGSVDLQISQDIALMTADISTSKIKITTPIFKAFNYRTITITDISSNKAELLIINNDLALRMRTGSWSNTPYILNGSYFGLTLDLVSTKNKQNFNINTWEVYTFNDDALLIESEMNSETATAYKIIDASYSIKLVIDSKLPVDFETGDFVSIETVGGID